MSTAASRRSRSSTRDSDQWVIVERILKVMFRDRATGRYKRFNFDWTKKPSETQDHTRG
jgi:hypothetical protein